MIIAIDGPAGAGKSTVCKILAKELGFVYLDTGAMYRAVAWALLEGRFDQGKAQSGKGDPTENQAGERLQQMPLLFSIKDNGLEICFADRVLSDELRGPEISEAASRISQMPEVREFLVGWQRKLARQGDIVAEGRDTTTVVFPNADMKVFLTADLQSRAGRRLAEYMEKGISLTLEEMEKRIQERDEADSNRDHSPMRQAEDAILLDTSHLNIRGVVERLEKLAASRMKAFSSNQQEL